MLGHPTRAAGRAGGLQRQTRGLGPWAARKMVLGGWARLLSMSGNRPVQIWIYPGIVEGGAADLLGGYVDVYKRTLGLAIQHLVCPRRRQGIH